MKQKFNVNYTKSVIGDKAFAMFKKIEAGNNKKIHKDEAIIMAGSWMGTNHLEYSSGDYEVHSVYSVVDDKYVTQIIHYSKGTVQDIYNVKNKMVQRLLHHFAQAIKTGTIK